MTDLSGPFASSGFQLISVVWPSETLRSYRDLLSVSNPPVRIAIERCIANRHFRLVSRRYHHQIELVGNRHQDHDGTRLQIFFSDVPWQSGENWLERGFEPATTGAIAKFRSARHIGRQRHRIETRLRRELVGQHQTAHTVRTQSVSRHRRAGYCGM